MNAILKAFVLGLVPLDGFIVLAPLVGMAGVQRIAHPFQHLVVELQPSQQFGELLFQHLLAHIATAAGSRVALAFIGVASAMVIDVAFLLDLADHRAAAGTTGDQPGEGEVVLAALGFLAVASVHHALNPFPQIDRDEWFVLAFDELAIPFELAGIKPVAQDRVHGAHGHFRAALGIAEACCLRLLGRFLQRNAAAGVPVEHFGHDGRDSYVDRDDLLAVRADDVAIAERRFGRPYALFGLFLHALAGFLGQIVDVVLCHQHLDAVHELFRRARLARQHHAFLGKVHLDVQLVHSYPILEVAVEPIRFLDQHHANGRMRLEIGNHFAESGAAGLLGSFDVDIFLHHREAVRRPVFVEELQLRRDRETFLLLLLGGNARIGHRLAASGIGNGCGVRNLFHSVYRNLNTLGSQVGDLAESPHPLPARIKPGTPNVADAGRETSASARLTLR